MVCIRAVTWSSAVPIWARLSSVKGGRQPASVAASMKKWAYGSV